MFPGSASGLALLCNSLLLLEVSSYQFCIGTLRWEVRRMWFSISEFCWAWDLRTKLQWNESGSQKRKNPQVPISRATITPHMQQLTNKYRSNIPSMLISDIKLFRVAGSHCWFQMMIIADQEMLWAHSGWGKLWHNNVRETNWIHQTFCTDTNMCWCSSFFLLVDPIPKGADTTHTQTQQATKSCREFHTLFHWLPLLLFTHTCMLFHYVHNLLIEGE